MRVRVKDFTLNPFQHLYFTSVKPDHPKPVFEGKENIAFPGNDPQILLVTGIARPETAMDLAKTLSPDVSMLAYSDHHHYTAGDIQTINRTFREMKSNNKVILTTEKDAVKFRMLPGAFESIRRYVYFLPISVSILNNDTEISIHK